MLTRSKFKPFAVLVCLFLVAFVFICLPRTEADAATYSGYCGKNGSNVNWEVDIYSYTLRITGIGDMADYSTSSKSPWYYYYYYIQNVIIEDGVTGIGDYAFYGHTSLRSVDISDSVTHIGTAPFSGCSALSSITLPFVGESTKNEGDTYQYPLGYLFGTSSYTGGISTTQYYYGSSSYNTTYSTYYIPSSLRTVTVNGGIIPYGAFYNCSSLTTITVGKDVPSIGDNALYGCYSLKNVNVNADNSAYKSIDGNLYSVDGKTLIRYMPAKMETIFSTPAGVNSIGEGAFRMCQNLTSVTIGDSVTVIGKLAFDDCAYLSTVNIGSGVTSIGENAFSDCGLTKVNIKSIENWCKISFYDCVANPIYYSRSLHLNGELLTELIIPETVTSIGEFAFYNCASISKVVVPKTVTSIGGSAFGGCSSLESITIPFVGGSSNATNASRITLFGYIFGTSGGGTQTTQYYSSGSSTNYYIPSSLKSVTIAGGNILYGAFYNCKNLTSIALGNDVTRIGDYAFSNCNNITEIIVPDSVTSIGYAAFRGWSSLESITIPFVGYPYDAANNVYQQPLGYIFGRDSYTGGVSTRQYYANPDGNTTSDYFYIPSSLRSVTVTGGNIPYGAFYSCSNLTDITIGNAVTVIGDNAFYNCSNLSNLALPDNLTSIGENAFYGSAFYNDQSNWESGGALYIKTYLIVGPNISEYTVKQQTAVIADGAFKDHSNLISIIIPNSVITIGEGAFRNCPKLVTITLPDSITLIGKEAFYYCSNLTEITLGSEITIIGKGAFEYCSKLNRVNITDIGSWCEISFADNMANPLCYADNLYVNGAKLTELTVPEGTDVIGDFAFYDYQYLTSVIIPDSVTTIGEGAFYDCNGLLTVTIGRGVRTIGKNAFYACSALKTARFNAPCGWYVSSSRYFLYTELSDVYLAARYLIDDYYDDYNYDNYTWSRDNHEYTVETVEATCTTKGYTTYTCPDCSFASTENIIPASGHSEYENVIILPTCTGGGCTVYTCTTCGDGYIGEVSEALGHTEVTDKAVAPTCTETGLTEGAHCSVCDAVITKQNIVPTSEHTFEDTVIPADCTNGGHTIHICSVCHYTYIGEFTEATGHTPVTDEAVAPTCTEIGLTEGSHCSICDAVITKQNTVPKAEHAFSDTVIPADCTNGGHTIHICSVCQYTYIGEFTEATGHTAVADKAIASTCTGDGFTEGSHCSVCAQILKNQNTVSAKGHSDTDDNGICDTCAFDLGKELGTAATIGIAIAGAAVLSAAQFVITWIMLKKKLIKR